MTERLENWNGMNWIRQEKRLAIYARDGFACVYCGKTAEDGTKLSLDHIIPASHGGNNEANNLITACVNCNCKRGDTDIFTFVSQLPSPATELDFIFAMLQRPINTKAAKLMLAARKAH